METAAAQLGVTGDLEEYSHCQDRRNRRDEPLLQVVHAAEVADKRISRVSGFQRMSRRLSRDGMGDNFFPG